MRKNKLIIFIIFLIVAASAVAIYMFMGQKKSSKETVKEITPRVGRIRLFISCTGTVLPKNRLEVKPPVNGRIETILVQEGEQVKAGQVLAWMSSAERAALLDAARGKDEKTLQYWEQAYKAIPLPAPIDGEVIVATTQPGQTVTTADAAVVLSDHLIVRAQVDETDIGKVTPDMKAIITLDAYQDKKIKAAVEHIYYESKTVNNVTIYDVDLKPENVPEFFRSGMNATVDFIQTDKEDILVIPVDAVYKENDDTYVFVKNGNGEEGVKTPVKLGITDAKNIEVISGISEKDTLIVKTKKFILPKSTATGTNPFMPARPGGARR